MRDFERAGDQKPSHEYEMKDDDTFFEDGKVTEFFPDLHHDDRLDQHSSNRQNLIVEEDAFDLAQTMRNPNINKLNILDTIADYKNFKSKK